jgi:hypothetical protein
VKRAATLLAVVALAAAACGGGSGQSAQEVLAETSNNLGDIQSGDLSLDLLFSAKSGERAGFTLQGPFKLERGNLPEAQLDYTQIAGGRTATQTFVMAGGKAYVSVRGTTYELPATAGQGIATALGNSGGLQVIDLSNWIQSPTIEDGGEVGGADTDRISGRLNVATVVSGLVAIASQFGGTTPLAPFQGASAQQVEDAVDTATIDVYTGKDDRLLRKLDVRVEFSPAAEKVKRLVGAAVRFTLGIDNPNEAVSVEQPANAKPYPGSLP